MMTKRGSGKRKKDEVSLKGEKNVRMRVKGLAVSFSSLLLAQRESDAKNEGDGRNQRE